MVSVEPPSTVLPDSMFLIAARTTPSASTPLWRQKRSSSIATVAFLSVSGMSASLTGVRRMSAWMKPRRDPSAA
jgi:hypothetical protein